MKAVLFLLAASAAFTAAEIPPKQTVHAAAKGVDCSSNDAGKTCLAVGFLEP